MPVFYASLEKVWRVDTYTTWHPGFFEIQSRLVFLQSDFLKFPKFLQGNELWADHSATRVEHKSLCWVSILRGHFPEHNLENVQKMFWNSLKVKRPCPPQRTSWNARKEWGTGTEPSRTLTWNNTAIHCASSRRTHYGADDVTLSSAITLCYMSFSSRDTCFLPFLREKRFWP